jgi:D-alanyl-D-alanine carboxypeptidase/D-alanyl-D-alanine-endopeptidase (penicillin-binding protein 4)
VSARAEVDLLAAMARHPLARVYRESLAVAGVDGTLKRRMAGSPAQGRVFAKTGSLRHVDAIAGYVDARSGRHLVFSLIVNHHTRPPKEATDALDEMCVLLTEIK